MDGKVMVMSVSSVDRELAAVVAAMRRAVRRMGVVSARSRSWVPGSRSVRRMTVGRLVADVVRREQQPGGLPARHREVYRRELERRGLPETAREVRGRDHTRAVVGQVVAAGAVVGVVASQVEEMARGRDGCGEAEFRWAADRVDEFAAEGEYDDQDFMETRLLTPGELVDDLREVGASSDAVAAAVVVEEVDGADPNLAVEAEGLVDDAYSVVRGLEQGLVDENVL